MINLFMDAQIWLSLYSFSSNDLKQFSKLKDCIANKEVNIIITDQIIDEVNRNRENINFMMLLIKPSQLILIFRFCIKAIPKSMHYLKSN